jgi:CheY-like chemotaxis protein
MISPFNVASTGGTVLIVDDDPAVRSSLQFFLEIEGFAVRTYSCGPDLLGDRLSIAQHEWPRPAVGIASSQDRAASYPGDD